MNDRVSFLLPGGLVDGDGRLQRRVELAHLTGREEEFLAGRQMQNKAALVTSLLSRCLRSIGDIAPVSPELTRQLLVADRQYLLLKLYEITISPRVQATINCPQTACGWPIDIDFAIEDVPVHPAREQGPWHQLLLSPSAALVDENNEAQREIVFRLPDGGDQEALAPLLSSAGAENEAAEILLARCIRRISRFEQPDHELINRLNYLARQEIEQQMEALAPQVDVTMEGICPECGHEFAIPLDIAGLLLQVLQINLDTLFRETHYLAYHYHWSEREIMAMSRPKRRGYIHILAEEIERLNHVLV